jgi:hypothetical protein
MTVIEALTICDEVYYHLIKMNLRFYKELYDTLTTERTIKAIINAQKELQQMIKDKHSNDYYERIKQNAV